jgi:hypothetical protein
MGDEGKAVGCVPLAALLFVALPVKDQRKDQWVETPPASAERRFPPAPRLADTNNHLSRESKMSST